MPTEYEIYKFFRKNAMPRSMDILIQGMLIVLFFASVYSIDLSKFGSEEGHFWLWFLVFVLFWWVQNFLLGKILMRRAQRVEASLDKLPEGLYQKLVKASAPHEMDMTFQWAGVFFFMDVFSPEWFSFLPEYLSAYVWIVIFLAAWQVHHIVLKSALSGRVFLTFFRGMYYQTQKMATA